MVGDRLPHVGEALAPPEIACRDARTEPQHRNRLAGVVGAGPGRVASVIGGDQREVARAQVRTQLGQPGTVELTFTVTLGDTTDILPTNDSGEKISYSLNRLSMKIGWAF